MIWIASKFAEASNNNKLAVVQNMILCAWYDKPLSGAMMVLTNYIYKYIYTYTSLGLDRLMVALPFYHKSNKQSAAPFGIQNFGYLHS